MAYTRCKETTLDSFYGNFVYEQIIPKTHFLVKLKEVIDWQRFTKKLLKYYNYRIKKKDRNKEGWSEIKDSQEYNEGLRQRYKIERKFGEVKKWRKHLKLG